MNWFLISLATAFIWSVLNHLDKYMISKYFKEASVGGIILFSALFSVVTLPFIFLIDNTVASIGFLEMFALSATGIFMAVGVLFSLYALETEDASMIVPFWLLTPVFGYILGLIFLGEHLGGGKIVGSLIVIAGALVLSFEFNEKILFRARPVILMVCASIFIAIGNIIFKAQAINTNFLTSVFWNQVGLVIFGLFCLVVIRSYRRDFFKIIDSHSVHFIGINIFAEAALILANLINYYAMLLAPVSLVFLVTYTFQPLFVFIEGLILTIWMPHIINEKLSRNHIIQKVLSMALMAIGLFFVYI